MDNHSRDRDSLDIATRQPLLRDKTGHVDWTLSRGALAFEQRYTDVFRIVFGDA